MTTYSIKTKLIGSFTNKEVCDQLQAIYDDDSRAPDGHFDITENTGSTVGITFSRDLWQDMEAYGKADENPDPKFLLDALLGEFSPTAEDGPAALALGIALASQETTCEIPVEA